MTLRYYVPEVGRFASPDTLVPDPGNPQSFNRYSYTNNNPINFIDPSGHCIDAASGNVIMGEGPYGTSGLCNNSDSGMPAIITYIHGEMITNASGPISELIRWSNSVASPWNAINFWPASIVANIVWGSQVMDARAKDFVGIYAPLIGNWDHKPILAGADSPVPEIREEPQFYSQVGDEQYFYDIWSNIHYGYVGAASGFSDRELINGAGLEQIASTASRGGVPVWSAAPTFFSGWDDPSDRAAIQIGAALWHQHELAVSPMDLYNAVLNEPDLTTFNND